ncbi:hypothetical protein JRO89_XS15G0150300 [Xanthoceras sorbifolium]|uniref:START domain-containing protein n=1 Tax=Xanthoceras sorbifolium TaxID=99658 RepID=A0ABQ8H295_9ROSI|nr:hypothetical protein JRO89_XS15G0150300 [Xanthoceras sorbifolium]
MSEVESDQTHRITNHNRDDLDDDLNSELRSTENFVEGIPSSDDENVMEVDNQLGLEPQENFEAGDDQVRQNEGDIDSSQFSVHHDQSSQDSIESRASTTNVRCTTTSPDQIEKASDLLMAVSVAADTNKTKITDLAYSAMEELTKMALEGEPLWSRRSGGDTNSQFETLNGFEYMKEFGSIDATLEQIMRMVEVGDPNCLPSLDQNPDDHRPPMMMPPQVPGELQLFHTEASREIGLVSTNAINIVDLFMDVNQWLAAFSNIVARATLLGVISTGEEGSYHGALQVLKAEFYIPTALVPSRETYFARYSKQLSPTTWGVVDVSLEDLFRHPFVKFRRRPSGCLIQDLFRGCSKVTWVEHSTVEATVHSIYRTLVLSGFGFGARRWVASLIGHCQWLAALGAATSPTTHDGVLIPQDGRGNLLKLSERMRRSFWENISASTGNIWMPLPINGAEDIRVMIRRNIYFLGWTAPSTKIVLTTSLWLPVSPKRLFHFLRDVNSRKKWDIRLRGHVIRELAYIKNGENPINRVSILQVNATPEVVEMLYLQDSFTDQTGSYVIYAPVDLSTMSRILNGGNPENVNILPCGFAILPDRPVFDGHGEDVCGSLLTIAFHIIDKVSAEENMNPESLNTIYRIITETVALIRNALVPSNLQDQ